jgi:hypothetical protein
MNRAIYFLCCLLAASAVGSAGAQSGNQASSSQSQSESQSQSQSDSSKAANSQAEEAAKKVPVIDGGAGPCSLDLTITANGKPVYAATVKVHIAYGFAGAHKLDLQAGTNVDGKVRFVGLPARVHRPPLEFDASKDGLQGVATDDPSSECQAKHDIVLEKPQPQSAQ